MADRVSTRRRLTLLALALLLPACPRTYVPTSPVRSRVNNSSVELREVHVHWVSAHQLTRASLAVTAPPGTELLDVRLSSPNGTPCSEGIGVRAISMDGRVEVHGPLSLGGSHELEVEFGDQLDERTASHASVVDLRFQTDEEVTCLRLPIADRASDGAGWRLHPESVGAWVDGGMHTLAVYGDLPGDDPHWLAFERVGVVFGEYRVFGAIEGGVDTSGSRGLVAFGLMADRRLWASARLGFRVGAGYSLALTTHLDGDPETKALQHVLHGPRAEPSLTLALLSPTGALGLPAGDRTVHLHLDVPLAVWFGFGAAPSAVFAAGAGVGLSAGF